MNGQFRADRCRACRAPGGLPVDGEAQPKELVVRKSHRQQHPVRRGLLRGDGRHVLVLPMDEAFDSPTTSSGSRNPAMGTSVGRGGLDGSDVAVQCNDAFKGSGHA